MITKGTRNLVMMSIMMAAMRQEFFRKIPKEEQAKKIKEWVESSLKKARKMGAKTDDDITEIFSESEKITFTKNGEIKIEALDPDEEILEIIKKMDLKIKK